MSEIEVEFSAEEYAQLKVDAERMNMTVNQYINYALSEAVRIMGEKKNG